MVNQMYARKRNRYCIVLVDFQHNLKIIRTVSNSWSSLVPAAGWFVSYSQPSVIPGALVLWQGQPGLAALLWAFWNEELDLKRKGNTSLRLSEAWLCWVPGLEIAHCLQQCCKRNLNKMYREFQRFHTSPMQVVFLGAHDWRHWSIVE